MDTFVLHTIIAISQRFCVRPCDASCVFEPRRRTQFVNQLHLCLFRQASGPQSTPAHSVSSPPRVGFALRGVEQAAAWESLSLAGRVGVNRRGSILPTGAWAVKWHKNLNERWPDSQSDHHHHRGTRDTPTETSVPRDPVRECADTTPDHVWKDHLIPQDANSIFCNQFEIRIHFGLSTKDFPWPCWAEARKIFALQTRDGSVSTPAAPGSGAGEARARDSNKEPVHKSEQTSAPRTNPQFTLRAPAHHTQLL